MEIDTKLSLKLFSLFMGIVKELQSSPPSIFKFFEKKSKFPTTPPMSLFFMIHIHCQYTLF